MIPGRSRMTQECHVQFLWEGCKYVDRWGCDYFVGLYNSSFFINFDYSRYVGY
ncbi:hypothetical protein AALP_AA3G228100 [Arabis alpina]|uniref:Uncharacterized protein n=1 Tax=Arabis alpina TaxID=50452 RepID=A0A087HB07_ARAAL|nr:hypothetical protein AALP_AA3G228100 [Arabis alpina]